MAFQRQIAKGQGILKDIAEEFSCPISKVEQILSAETHQHEQGAHIKDFIPVLAIKEVKDRLRTYQPTRHEQPDRNHPKPTHEQSRP